MTYDDQKLQPTPMAERLSELRDVLEDIVPHFGAIEDAIKSCIDSAPPPSEDMDDRGYWQHELNAFAAFQAKAIRLLEIKGGRELMPACVEANRNRK
jgi:hypothetical protein